ncbi:hypothetical protein [Petrocella sp. FN5]|uniref:hypothetical protein n=1 Tax=Petrocella sp. FN5 TaxID=3032002 RepID=UPI0023DAD424|nr:hypothetical protein [Petrocella sp. FN5]MDF1617308.1 hypothetical protein [Petrocella sp. FN5]
MEIKTVEKRIELIAAIGSTMVGICTFYMMAMIEDKYFSVIGDKIIYPILIFATYLFYTNHKNLSRVFKKSETA